MFGLGDGDTDLSTNDKKNSGISESHLRWTVIPAAYRHSADDPGVKSPGFHNDHNVCVFCLKY